ncbi:amidohydrolase family protein [Agrobacterium sp. NPDC089420]|uniref:amidohydrolase family protein n=1 Tax=Agrobacterium sp. NPDC089420 TaxID=3363918 RepID=UPI0038508D01
MQRREFMKLGMATAALSLTGCRTYPDLPMTGQLVDAHCHVFNASDLPVVRFIKHSVLAHYPRQTETNIMKVRDPDLEDFLIDLAQHLLGVGSAPTAREEMEVLEGRKKSKRVFSDYEAAQAQAVAQTAVFLQQLQEDAGGGLATMGVREKSRAERQLDAFLAAIGENAPRTQSLSPLDTTRLATKSFSRLDQIGAYLRWIPLFRLYRHKLVARLIEDQVKQGRDPLLLAPATVDFDHWLNEKVDRSPLPDQAKLMGLLAKRKDGPLIHAYFGFDPLREIYHRAGNPTFSPMKEFKRALNNHGFLGAKLYPPMGFSASGNKPPYPFSVKKDLGIDPSTRLNNVLGELYAFCEDEGVPILAHANASNGAGPDYNARADVAFWLPVFKSRPKLRVCLAHFGHFAIGDASKDRAQSWEWRFGSYIRDNPDAPVYADLSFFSELLNADSRQRSQLADDFNSWTEEFDRDADHLVFGTDWLMLGMHPGYGAYIPTVERFLVEDCKWPEHKLSKVFTTNALRFMGLQRGDKTLGRLEDFYRRNSLDVSRLQRLSDSATRSAAIKGT